jgi:hypothetical protein
MSIRISEISGVDDVDIPLLDNLSNSGDTLLLGLVKNSNQFSAWSKTSGIKIRLGLSAAVDAIRIPLS